MTRQMIGESFKFSFENISFPLKFINQAHLFPVYLVHNLNGLSNQMTITVRLLHYSSHGLNNKLLAWGSGHGLNNKLLPGI